MLDQVRHVSPYHKGIRITDQQSLNIVMQASGQLQLTIIAQLSMSLANTLMAGTQLNVVSGNFVTAQPLGIDEGLITVTAAAFGA